LKKQFINSVTSESITLPNSLNREMLFIILSEPDEIFKKILGNISEDGTIAMVLALSVDELHKACTENWEKLNDEQKQKATILFGV